MARQRRGCRFASRRLLHIPMLSACPRPGTRRRCCGRARRARGRATAAASHTAARTSRTAQRPRRRRRRRRRTTPAEDCCPAPPPRRCSTQSCQVAQPLHLACHQRGKEDGFPGPRSQSRAGVGGPLCRVHAWSPLLQLLAFRGMRAAQALAVRNPSVCLSSGWLAGWLCGARPSSAVLAIGRLGLLAPADPFCVRALRAKACSRRGWTSRGHVFRGSPNNAHGRWSSTNVVTGACVTEGAPATPV
jgi:hypothetical protein